METKTCNRDTRQPLTVKVMDDEEFIDYLLVNEGQESKKVKALWDRLQKIKNAT